MSAKTIEIQIPSEIGYCHCGCGMSTKWDRRRKTWYRFIAGHQCIGRIRLDIQERFNQPPPLCKCGCGIDVTWNDQTKQWNKYVNGGHVNKILYNEKDALLCKCGCNLYVVWSETKNKWNKYIKGHQWKDIEFKANVSAKISQSLTKIFPIDESPKCVCGCGANTEWNQKKKRWNKLADHDNQSSEYKAYFASKTKAKWDIPEYKQALIETHKKRCNTAEHKEKVSKQVMEHWQNQEYRDNIVSQIKKRTNTKEYKEYLSERAKDLWATSEYRDSVMAKLSDPKMKAQISNSVKQLWTNPEYRQNSSDKMKQHWATPEYRNKIVNIHKELWKQSEYLKKQLSPKDRKPNKVERIIELLTPDNIIFVGNSAFWKTVTLIDENGNEIIRHKNPDFVIKNTCKIIEMNGDFWHRKDYPDEMWIEAWKRIGYDLLIIWEHEIKEDINKVLDKIASFAERDSWQMSLNI